MFGRKKETQLTGPLTEDSLRQWLVDHLAQRIEVSPAEIDTTKSFEAYGLDSRVAVQVSGSLEKVVERRLSPGLLYEHQTIDDLSRYLAQELRLSGRTG
ncbi:polyketide synthase [Streptomyces eurocidicus]|uniref:Acyl carrier protein n=1 Tax=Streptomyces eurocidicus TaxID=66423 RepID=A0A2N8NZI7_STREU|nr:acyl carrier protein [Streptomyces eurocidicus]MBB5120897.1 acyl carrier protein [Streptomyces eurocidicus]MBF6054406.1 polyketide synthase [Streptomyces eurocidicus]PNE34182.1 polyketide synthase [Streptomyces eurocidicus]